MMGESFAAFALGRYLEARDGNRVLVIFRDAGRWTVLKLMEGHDAYWVCHVRVKEL